VKPLSVRGGKAMVEQRDEVICVSWAPGSTIEGEDAKAANAVVARLCRGRRYPLLLNITGTRAVTHRKVRAGPAGDGGFAGSWAYRGSRPGLRSLLCMAVGRTPARLVAAVSGTLEPAGPAMA
jgi:hypothetical protein